MYLLDIFEIESKDNQGHYLSVVANPVQDDSSSQDTNPDMNLSQVCASQVEMEKTFTPS